MELSIFGRVMQETEQSRKKLLEKIESHFNKRVLTYATSPYVQNSMIDETDVVMIETALHSMDDIKIKGLLLLINSNGGYGLSAEKIINVCRSYASTYDVVIPKSAKSAATMIALGADTIWMSKTSELGPVDPQISGMPAYCITKTYNDLMENVANAKGRIEGYLQQLQNYRAIDIEKIKMETNLAVSITTKALHNGMMKDKTEEDIAKQITIFTNPEETLSHGRMINLELLQSSNIGLTVNEIKLDSMEWTHILELFFRIDYLFQTQKIQKIIETKTNTYLVGGA